MTDQEILDWFSWAMFYFLSEEEVRRPERPWNRTPSSPVNRSFGIPLVTDDRA